MKREEIFDLIREERARQDLIWGGIMFDEKNTPNDWVTYITHYAARAAMKCPIDYENFRKDMIKVAALAVAAIETMDSLGGKLAKRHYDR
jgi:hypothetical protein